MHGFAILLLAPAAFGLSGCLAKTALDVATAPVKVVSKGVDLATTSQSEADQKRGREIRKREERLGQLQRERDKLEKKCGGGDENACNDLAQVNAEIRTIMPTVPYEPDR
ncbi:MAG: hypothetical protein ACTHKM_05400 [Tsuneonella sp.]